VCARGFLEDRRVVRKLRRYRTLSNHRGKPRQVVPGGFSRSVASYAQLDGFRRGTLSHSMDYEGENGRSKSTGEILRSFEGRWIHTHIVNRGFVSRSLKLLQQEWRYPDRSEPSISGDACQKVRRSQSLTYRRS
jgi:hypothetical protein